MLPNILTVFRIAVTGVFIHFLLSGGFKASFIAVVAFVVGSLTDYLDGYIARKYNLISDFGKIMDPIADKFLVLSAFFVFVRLELISAWVVWAIAFREIIITLLRLKAIGKNKIIAAEQLGKIKTVGQIVAIAIILFLILLNESNSIMILEPLWLSLIMVLMGVVLLLTIASGLENIWNNRRVYFVR